MLLVFLAVGLIAGFRGVLRAVARADRAARRTSRTTSSRPAAPGPSGQKAHAVASAGAGIQRIERLNYGLGGDPGRRPPR